MIARSPDIIDHFRSYDEIVAEIDRKHTKYIRNAVERAKFLLLNTNNMEGKVSTVLQYLAEEFNEEEKNNLAEEVPDDICILFNIFPQGFLKTLDRYTALRRKKDRLLARDSIRNVIGDYPLEDDISDILTKLLLLDDSGIEPIELSITALKVKAKIEDEYALLRRNIEENVTK